MARQQIEREQNNVSQKDQRAHTDEEMAFKPEGANGVIPEEAEEDDRPVEEVAVNILQDEREFCLAAVIPVGAFAHRTGRRIEKECPVISFAIVVAGYAEAQRKCQDQQSGRVVPPTMGRVNQWGVERREIRAPFEICSFKSAERGIDA